MKRAIIFICIILVTVSVAFSRSTYKTDGNKIIVSLESNKAQTAVIEIDIWTDGCVKITSHFKEPIVASKSLFNGFKPDRKVNFKVVEAGYDLEISTLDMRISISEDGIISFFDSKGNRMLLEDSKSFSPIEQETGKYAITQRFFLTTSEHLFGLGINNESKSMNLRDQEIELLQLDNEVVAPVLYSEKGWVMLWDNYSKTSYKNSKTRLMLESEAASSIEYFFVTGEDVDMLNDNIRQVIGQAPILPRMAWDFWYSGNYSSVGELYSCKKAFDDHNLDVDNFIVNPTSENGKYHFDGSSWSEISDLNAVVKITPFVDDVDNKAAILKSTPEGNLVNPMSEEGVVFYKDKVNSALSSNFKGVWYDQIQPPSCETIIEDIFAEESSEDEDEPCLMKDQINAYPLILAAAVADDVNKGYENKRPLIFSDGAFSGQQRYTSFVLTGRPGPSWKDYQSQVRNAINMSLSGFPFFGTPIGGVSDHLAKDNESIFYKELYARWFQFGVFNPLFYTEEYTPWDFGGEEDPVYQSIVSSLALRNALMPYIYTTAIQVSEQNSYMLRSLVEDYKSDKKVYNIENQYLFGPSLMIAPVTEKFYTDFDGYKTIPEKNLKLKDQKTNGLSANYYNGPENKKKLAYQRIDKKIHFGWDIFVSGIDDDVDTYSSPVPDVDMLFFIGEWEGFLKTNEAGVYLIKLQANKSGEADGVTPVKYSLEIDGKKIISGTNKNLITEAQIDLPANTLVPIKIEYVNESSDPGINLQWKTPSEIKSIKSQDAQIVEVYLPKGENWYNFWTGERYDGGQTISVSAPLNQIPIFVKEGTILPMAFDYKKALENGEETISELRIYRGKEAKYAIYEDEGSNLDYLERGYNRIPFNWNNDSKQIVIGQIEGEFADSKEERTFKFSFVSDDNGIGLVPSEKAYKIEYEGKKERLKIKD